MSLPLSEYWLVPSAGPLGPPEAAQDTHTSSPFCPLTCGTWLVSPRGGLDDFAQVKTPGQIGSSGTSNSLYKVLVCFVPERAIRLYVKPT